MNEMQITILLVEDNDAHVALIERTFQTRTPQTILHVVSTLKQAQSLLAVTSVDLVIADWLLPDGRGIDLLPADAPEPPFPVILMTGTQGKPVGVPRPVVKTTTWQPEATSPVTASPSWPTQSSRYSPGPSGYSP